MEWIKGLNVGDEVVIRPSGVWIRGHLKLRKVVRKSKSSVWVEHPHRDGEEMRFHIKSGREYGGDQYHYTIVEATPQLAARVHREEILGDISRLEKNIDHAPTDKLVIIRDILVEAERAKKDKA